MSNELTRSLDKIYLVDTDLFIIDTLKSLRIVPSLDSRRVLVNTLVDLLTSSLATGKVQRIVSTYPLLEYVTSWLVKLNAKSVEEVVRYLDEQLHDFVYRTIISITQWIGGPETLTQYREHLEFMEISTNPNHVGIICFDHRMPTLHNQLNAFFEAAISNEAIPKTNHYRHVRRY